MAAAGNRSSSSSSTQQHAAERSKRKRKRKRKLHRQNKTVAVLQTVYLVLSHTLHPSTKQNHLYPKQVLHETLVGELVHERRQGVVGSVQQQESRAAATRGSARVALSCVVPCHPDRRQFSSTKRRRGTGDGGRRGKVKNKAQKKGTRVSSQSSHSSTPKDRSSLLIGKQCCSIRSDKNARHKLDL